jgi:hypothetical protein
MTSHHLTTTQEEEEVLAEIKRALNIDDDNVEGASSSKPVETITIPYQMSEIIEINDDCENSAAHNSSDHDNADTNNESNQHEPRQSALTSAAVGASSSAVESGILLHNQVQHSQSHDATTATTTADSNILLQDRTNSNTAFTAKNYITSGTFISTTEGDIEDHHNDVNDGGDGSASVAADDDESWQSHEEEINLLQDGADDMTYDELLELVERLYSNLKQADAALTKEKSRRSGRENNLIKLAKELRSRKNKIDELEEQIDDVSGISLEGDGA